MNFHKIIGKNAKDCKVKNLHNVHGHHEAYFGEDVKSLSSSDPSCSHHSCSSKDFHENKAYNKEEKEQGDLIMNNEIAKAAAQ
jgi:hypothetical protein